jgi:Tfp pilus assembly protein PilN
MIEINLLPPHLRVRRKEPMKLPSLPVIPIAAGIVAVLFAIQILLWFFIQVKSVSRDSLKKKIASIAATNKEAITIDNTLRDISVRVDIIDKLSGSRFNLARKLNDISDSLVSGAWLRSLSIKKNETPNEPGSLKETLVIEGSNIILGEAGEAAIGKFVNSLKENESFSSDFDEIELAKEERKKVQKTEIMDFIIICHFKKGKGL